MVIPESKKVGPFRLLLLDKSKIEFKNVYCNGFHSLKKIEVQNLLNEPLRIKLNSTLQDQLVFQLTNENLQQDVFNIATNTSSTPQDFARFNQVFNYVNYIRSIHLDPHQKLAFVMAFLPATQTCTSSVKTATLSTIVGTVNFSTRDYRLDVDFEATVCQSILAADELESDECIFEDGIVVGETYIRDITIRNLSAIDLYWRLNTLDLLNTTAAYGCLQFVDASTFMTLDQFDSKPIAPFSCYTFHIVFTPKETGKFIYDIQIENINDVRNIILTKIQATVRSYLRKETLIVSSGSLLDFGDCISGSWNTQRMVLKNISESSLEIHFEPDGAELGFDIKIASEEDNQDSNRAEGTINTSASNTGKLVQFSQYNDPALRSNNGIVSNISSSSAGLTRPASPIVASNRTHSECCPSSSTHSYASTDLEIDMLKAFDEVYHDTSFASTTSSLTKQVSKTIEKKTEEENVTKVEDIVIKAGAEKVIQVSYRPVKDDPRSVYAGQFVRQSNFRIILEYRPNKTTTSKDLKYIQCKARTCTSFVKVTPQAVDFGNVDVGEQKSVPITITNISDICAHVAFVFESKVLSCTQNYLLIKPRSKIEVKLDIYPRKINTSYKRQIKLVNYLNPDNDQIIEVASNNVDKRRVSFHSLFYQILTPTGANFLDFGPIALNSASIRTCTLVNVRDAPLLLGIFTSIQQEIVVYTKKKRYNPRKLLSTTPSSLSIQKFEEKPSVVTDTLIAMNHRTKMTNVQYASTAYLDLATIPHIPLCSAKQHRKYITRRLMKKKNGPLVQTKEVSVTVDETQAAKKFKASAVDKRVSSTSQVQKRLLKKKQEKNCIGITCTAASLKKKRRDIDWPDIAGKSRVPLDDLISILEHGSLSRTPLFARQSLEEQFVRYQIAWRAELDRLIEKGELVPASLLQLDPKEEEEIIVVYTPKKEDSQSLTTKKAATIGIRLIDFDRSILSHSSSSSEEEDGYRRKFIPVLRKIIVKAQICKTAMELGQRNINFGMVDRGERHHKTIMLHNKSETPLLYTIKRSGSIASGDIHLDAGQHGVIRAFGKREIDFIFVPSLPGLFMEQLVVSNIRDKQDKNTILLKALVRRPDSFNVNKASTDLLVIQPHCNMSTSSSSTTTATNRSVTSSSGIETIVVTNTSKQSRTFEIRVETAATSTINAIADSIATAQQRCYIVDFIIMHQSNNEGMLSKEELEEEIETLEQKLKIAVRKEQPDKVEKYTKRLAKLKQVEESNDNTTEITKEEDQKEENNDDQVIMAKEQYCNNFAKKLDQDSAVFALEPNASVQITLCFKAVRSTTTATATTATTKNEGQIFHSVVSGRVLIHEHKNMDTCKTFPFSAYLCTDHDSCLVDLI